MQLAPSSIAARVQQEDDAVLGSAKPLLDRIIELPQPDGTSKWISTTKAPVLDEHGKVSGLVGITRDITQRKRSEQALLESEKRYRSLYNRAPVMMCTTTAAGKIVAAKARKSSVLGKSVSVRVHLGGRRTIKNNNSHTHPHH